MRSTLYLLLGIIGSPLSSLFASVPSSPTPTKIDAFLVEADAAIKSGDREKIRALYYLEGTPEDEVELMLKYWPLYAKYGNYQECLYLPIDSEEAKKMNPQFLAQATQSATYNGLTESPNLEVIGFLNPKYANKDNPKSITGRLFPVGLTPSGQLKLTGVALTGTPLVKAEPTPPPIITPQPITEAQIKALEAAVTQAYTEGSPSDRLLLHDLRGATQGQVNQLAKNDLLAFEPKKFPFEKMEFVPLEATDPGKAAASIELYQAYQKRGNLLADGQALNLPIVGVAVIHFQVQGGRGSYTTTPLIGMNEKEELKIPTPIPAAKEP